VFLTGRPLGWRALRTTGLIVIGAIALGLSGAVQARNDVSGTVALTALPVEAQTTHQRIMAGGPFPYRKDGATFANRERQLPSRPRGFYHEYTVPTPGAWDRGARRMVCGGLPVTQPQACYYTGDHYATYRRIEP
jgi:ribonuclease T1